MAVSCAWTIIELFVYRSLYSLIFVGLKNWILLQRVLRRSNQFWKDGWRRLKIGKDYIELIMLIMLWSKIFTFFLLICFIQFFKEEFHSKPIFENFKIEKSHEIQTGLQLPFTRNIGFPTEIYDQTWIIQDAP